MRELLKPPNLLSLSRVLLTPVVAYYVAGHNLRSRLICLGLLLVAAITDGLDGWLARRTGQVSRLGIALDPIADKIFAGALVVLLIAYREFPLWLAATIIGRDLLIMLAGLLLMRGRTISLPSNLTGKYAFSAIAVLLGSYVIEYPFGITMTTPITLLLLAASIVNYARTFALVRRGQSPPVFRDKPLFRAARTIVTWGLSAWFLYKLYLYAFVEKGLA
jgi:CDP-diacylglycerol--glycerol-3-phosphate 3-phosphatidyltransferase